jgi:hypothetical protein
MEVNINSLANRPCSGFSGSLIPLSDHEFGIPGVCSSFYDRSSAGQTDAAPCSRYDYTRGSNPFAFTPYGVFKNPEQAERQTFRKAGGGLGIRSFMHPFNWQGIAHGTSSCATADAAVLAKAAALFGVPAWRALAERQIQWTVGHNTLNRSLYNGIGYRHPWPSGCRDRFGQIPGLRLCLFRIGVQRWLDGSSS